MNYSQSSENTHTPFYYTYTVQGAFMRLRKLGMRHAGRNTASPTLYT